MVQFPPFIEVKNYPDSPFCSKVITFLHLPPTTAGVHSHTGNGLTKPPTPACQPVPQALPLSPQHSPPSHRPWAAPAPLSRCCWRPTCPSSPGRATWGIAGVVASPPFQSSAPRGRVALLLCMNWALLTLVCCVKKGRAKGEKFSVKQFVPGPGTEQASAEGFTVPPGGGGYCGWSRICQWKSYLPSPPQMTGGGYLQGLLVGSIFQCLVRGARNISSKASRKNAHFYNKQIENLKIFSQYHPKMFKKFKIRILGICFQAQSRWKMHAPG